VRTEGETCGEGRGGRGGKGRGGGSEGGWETKRSESVRVEGVSKECGKGEQMTISEEPCTGKRDATESLQHTANQRGGRCI